MENFKITNWGHFQDPKIEKEYVDSSWPRHVAQNRLACLFAGIGFFTIIIVDLNHFHNVRDLEALVVLRIGILLMGLILFFYNPKNVTNLHPNAVSIYALLYPIALVAVIFLDNEDKEINAIDLLTFPIVILSTYLFPALPAKRLLYACLSATFLYVALLGYVMNTPFDVLFPILVILATINSLGVFSIVSTRRNNRKRYHLTCMLAEEVKQKGESESRLKLLLEEKDDLVGLLSHDMRAPLNQVKALSHLLKLSIDDKPTMEKSLVMLNEVADAQLALYSDVLRMLKADQMTIDETNSQKVNILEMAGQVKKGFLVDLKSKNLDLTLSMPVNLWAAVQGDLFIQAIKNLVQNAIKFSNPGGQITIHAEGQKDRLKISIIDKGIGFSPSKALSLFDRFTKSTRKGTNNEPSTGLGLYLTKKIVEAHKGTIVAQSEGPDTGSIFTINMPALLV